MEFAFNFFANPHHWTYVQDIFPIYEVTLIHPAHYPKRPALGVPYEVNFKVWAKDHIYQASTITCEPYQHLTQIHRIVSVAYSNTPTLKDTYLQSTERILKRQPATWDYRFRSTGVNQTHIRIELHYPIRWFEKAFYWLCFKFLQWGFSRYAIQLSTRLEQLYQQRMVF